MPMDKLEAYQPFSWSYYLVWKITEKGILFTPEYFKKIYIMLRELVVSKEIIGGNAHKQNEGIALLKGCPNDRAEEFEK